MPEIKIKYKSSIDNAAYLKAIVDSWPEWKKNAMQSNINVADKSVTVDTSNSKKPIDNSSTNMLY